MAIFGGGNGVSLLDAHVRQLSILGLADIELGLLLILIVLMVTDLVVAILNNS